MPVDLPKKKRKLRKFFKQKKSDIKQIKSTHNVTGKYKIKCNFFLFLIAFKKLNDCLKQKIFIEYVKMSDDNKTKDWGGIKTIMFKFLMLHVRKYAII